MHGLDRDSAPPRLAKHSAEWRFPRALRKCRSNINISQKPTYIVKKEDEEDYVSKKGRDLNKPGMTQWDWKIIENSGENGGLKE